LHGPITVSFDVTNAGKREGVEIAELYVGDNHASVPRPVKELKGFSRVNLKPGQSKRVSISLDSRAFAFYDVSKKDWNAEPGEFSLMVGASSDDIRLKGTFTLAQ
jgi:beta-glucosidase